MHLGLRLSYEKEGDLLCQFYCAFHQLLFMVTTPLHSCDKMNDMKVQIGQQMTIFICEVSRSNWLQPWNEVQMILFLVLYQFNTTLYHTRYETALWLLCFAPWYHLLLVETSECCASCFFDNIQLRSCHSFGFALQYPLTLSCVIHLLNIFYYLLDITYLCVYHILYICTQFFQF